MECKVEYKKSIYDYYEIYVDGKGVNNYTIDKKPNGKFGIYNLTERDYTIKEADNTTLKACKEYFEKHLIEKTIVVEDFCDDYCRFPYECNTQEELDKKCYNCKLNNFFKS